MPLPHPTPGLVLHYQYLWRHEHLQGQEEGRKRRPCVIVVAVATGAGGVETVVAPVTHREPVPPTEAIELPQRVKAHLGLDDERSWVVVSDLNVFKWPGYDLAAVPGHPRTFAYGHLPPVLYERIRRRIAELGTLAAATLRD